MTGTFLAFGPSAFPGLRLHLEGFPAARAAASAWHGAGVVADYASSVGLETAAPSGEKRATRYTRLELGALYRTLPLGSLGLVLTPRLTYLAQKLTVSPAITGLPDADLSGVRIGLGAEARVSGSVTLLAGLGWVKWLTAQELIKGSPAFFPGGSAWGLELEAGAGVALTGTLSLRLVGEYATTRYSLDADPTGTYAASSAEDRTLSIRAMVRGEF